MLSHTKECCRARDLPGLFVREQLLVPLVRRKPDSHLRYNTTQDGSQTLIQPHCRFSPYDLPAGADEATGFYLDTALVCDAGSLGGTVLTPGARALRDSCIRTLTVSTRLS